MVDMQLLKDVMVILKRAELNGFFIDNWWITNDTIGNIYLNPEKFDKAYMISTVISDYLYNVIFLDHSFAKSYFGEDEVCRMCGTEKIPLWGICQRCRGYENDFVPKYNWHLREMVIQETPEDLVEYIKSTWRGVQNYVKCSC